MDIYIMLKLCEVKQSGSDFFVITLVSQRKTRQKPVVCFLQCNTVHTSQYCNCSRTACLQA